MKYVFLSILFIWIVSAKTTLDPKSAKVAIETVFLLEPKNYERNIAFIQGIKHFLDKIYSLLEPQMKMMRARNQTRSKFRKILNDVGKRIVELNDSATKNVLESFREAANNVKEDFEYVKNDFLKAVPTIRKGKGKNKKKPNFKLPNWAKQNLNSIKSDVIKVIKSSDPVVNDVLNKIAKYVDKKDLENLKKIKHSISKKEKLTPVLMSTFKYLIEKYKNFNDTIKEEVHEDFESLTKFFIEYEQYAENLITDNLQVLNGISLKSGYNISSEDHRNEKAGSRKTDAKNLTNNFLANHLVVDNVEFIVQPLK